MQLTPHGFSDPQQGGRPSSSQARFVELPLLSGQQRPFALITCVSEVCLLPYHIRIPISISTRRFLLESGPPPSDSSTLVPCEALVVDRSSHSFMRTGPAVSEG